MTDLPREQRKLAAIMFTDIVGYSALSQRDDKLALELLEEHRDILRTGDCRRGACGPRKTSLSHVRK
jgi:class 3 adenylate cyclase